MLQGQQITSHPTHVTALISASYTEHGQTASHSAHPGTAADSGTYAPSFKQQLTLLCGQPAGISGHTCHATRRRRSILMVCITVQQLSAGREPPSWCIIELQGTIERLVQPEAGGLTDLGTLCVPPHSLDVVHLTLGSHQLEGKVVPLKKPLAILDFQADDGNTDGTAQRCEIVGVIRHKYVFKTRPKPLITKLSK